MLLRFFHVSFFILAVSSEKCHFVDIVDHLDPNNVSFDAIDTDHSGVISRSDATESSHTDGQVWTGPRTSPVMLDTIPVVTQPETVLHSQSSHVQVTEIRKTELTSLINKSGSQLLGKELSVTRVFPEFPDFGENRIILEGFKDGKLNGIYSERTGAGWTVGGQSTFWSSNNYFIYQLFDSSYRVTRASDFVGLTQELMVLDGPWVAQANNQLKDWKELQGVELVEFENGKQPSSRREQACRAQQTLDTSACLVINRGYGQNIVAANWGMFGADGQPKFYDVRQGSLGTCYMLAAMAAIAKQHPDLIKAMFVKDELWNPPQGKHPVYVTRWMVTGQPTLVAVSDKFPVSFHGKPAFARPSFRSFAPWPMVLEKAWAKMFKSYKKVEGGDAGPPFTAMLQAPVDYFDWNDGSNDDVVWDKLKQQLDKKYPMTAWVTNDEIQHQGVSEGHAYAVLGYKEVDDERAVELYNPWSFSRYKELSGLKQWPNSGLGEFVVAFEDFIDIFGAVAFAQVQQNQNQDYYKLSHMLLPVLTHSSLGFAVREQVKFRMTDYTEFTVMLVWPTERFSRRAGCDAVKPKVEMQVHQEGLEVLSSLQTVVENHRDRQAASRLGKVFMRYKGLQADLDYVITVKMEIPKGYWLADVTLYVYASQEVTFVKIPFTLDQSYDEHASQGGCKPVVEHGAMCDNEDEIFANGADTKFPEAMQSIAHNASTCWSPLDLSTSFDNCEMFNHWLSIQEIMDDARR